MVGPASNPERQPEQTAGPGVGLSLEFVGGERLDNEPPFPVVGYLALRAPITPINEALFIVDQSSGRSEIPRQGSALIVSMLQCSVEMQRINPKASTRGICFFDTKGNFHPFAKPISVDLIDKDDRLSGIEMKKHTARFLMAGQNTRELTERTVTIDSIHAIATSPYRLQPAGQPL